MYKRAFDVALIVMTTASSFHGAISAHAQQVTLENVLYKGDLLPNGRAFLNASWAVIDGDTIAFEATDADKFEHWICTMDLNTRAITIHAGSGTPSPTYPSKTLSGFFGPTMAGGRLAFPARTGGTQMEGIYTPTSSGLAAVVDQLHPAVNFPTLSVTDGTSVLFRDNGYADERIGHATYDGGFLGWLATSGSPVPGGGTFFEFEPPFIKNGLGVFQARYNLANDSLLGIFTWDRAAGVMERIAKEGDPFPGHPEPLLAVGTPGTDGTNVAFFGYANPFPWTSGLFLWDGVSVRTIAKSGTPLPGSGASLYDFNSEVPMDNGNLAFLASSANLGVQGAYAYYNEELIKIVDSTAPINGLPIYSMSLRYNAFEANRVAMVIQLDNCCSNGGIYIATIESECYADCDKSGGLDFFDFLCFQNEFAAGCP